MERAGSGSRRVPGWAGLGWASHASGLAMSSCSRRRRHRSSRPSMARRRTPVTRAFPIQGQTQVHNAAPSSSSLINLTVPAEEAARRRASSSDVLRTSWRASQQADEGGAGPPAGL